MPINRREWERYDGSHHHRVCNSFNYGLDCAFAVNPDPLGDAAVMEGLFLLLDKSYSAWLRRSVRNWREQSNSPISLIVENIYGKARRLERFTAIMERNVKALSQKTLPDLIQRTDALADLLSEANGTEGERRPLSFASKLLHYRLGVLPIWDNLARKALCAIRGRGSYRSYSTFATDFFETLQEIHHNEATFSREQVKRLDNFLIFKGG